ncbi:MAG: AbrB/MazE/SpoVT family DNA-binding domain-containing protein [Rubrobacter sp.]|nr:AbrB/MazE/SpoVT family DNA-binding domain-containing protein [Rubrobacter sp.]
MQTVRAKVTSKGQITIPAEIRRFLGVDAGDAVSFTVEGETVRLEVSEESVVERTAGALSGDESVENLREAAERAIAEEVVERSGK